MFVEIGETAGCHSLAADYGECDEWVAGAHVNSMANAAR